MVCIWCKKGARGGGDDAVLVSISADFIYVDDGERRVSLESPLYSGLCLELN